MGGTSFLSGLGAVTPRKRGVFFSFHFESDLLRVNVVRMSGQFLESKGHFDKSLWEKTKAEGDEALKRLINNGLEGTTVTCILAGAETYLRPWVRYEIAKSVVRGNGLLTVDISKVQCMQTGFCAQGPNPLAYMGLAARGGSFFLCELINGDWKWYDKYTLAVEWPPYLPRIADGYVQALNNNTQYSYWSTHQELSQWADKAARDAGKN